MEIQRSYRRLAGLLIVVTGALSARAAPGQDDSAADAAEPLRSAAEAPAPLQALALRAAGAGGAAAEIRLDGWLDEPDWAAAPAASGFRQSEPNEGAPASEPTEVRVLFDSEYLYIGVWAHDSEPRRIIARQLRRDAPLGRSRFGGGTRGGDDAIELILDTFDDNRNAYYFATNPQGVQVDGLITDESFRPDLNWDAVWDVRARITADGWTAEIAIPFRTLRFPESEGESSWGFNVQRVVGRKNEQSLWTSWSRQGEGLTRVSRAGELAGLQVPNQGTRLAFKPYTLGEAARDYENEPFGGTAIDGAVGVDAKLGFSSGLLLDLTVNTDFAQVEADDEQVDLTRFNLFFPEKREFFLENAGIFQFGDAGFFRSPPILLFFSRRIGLEDTDVAGAQSVPIIGGARLTGRAGGQTIGFLNAVTAEEETLGVPLSNFAVARIKRDIGQRSHLGAIVTHRYEDDGFTNVAGGVDWTFWLSRPMKLEGFYARTSQTGPGGDDRAWRLNLDYTGDWLGWSADQLEIGPELTPGIGFVRRHDIARSRLYLRLTPRPPIPGLRKIDFVSRFEYVASAETRGLMDRRLVLSARPELDSGDRGRVEIERRFQRLDEPFELTEGPSPTEGPPPDEGVIVPAGDYEDWVLAASVNSSGSRPVSVGVQGRLEDFWGGERWGAGGSVNFSSPHIGVELRYDHNDIDIPGGAFTTDLVSGRLNLALNTRLFGNALIQYNSQTGSFSTNLRVRFIYRPGSDFFIVFNERRDVEAGRWSPANRAFILKLTYLRWF